MAFDHYEVGKSDIDVGEDTYINPLARMDTVDGDMAVFFLDDPDIPVGTAQQDELWETGFLRIFPDGGVHLPTRPKLATGASAAFYGKDDPRNFKIPLEGRDHNSYKAELRSVLKSVRPSALETPPTPTWITHQQRICGRRLQHD